MKKFVIAFIVFCFAAFSAFSFDLVVPEESDTSYYLLDGDEDFIVDGSVFYKRFDDVLIERYGDNITLLSYDHDNYLIVLLNATEEDIEDQIFSLSLSCDNPDVLLVSSPISFYLLDELDVDNLFISGSITSRERAFLRARDIDFVELDPSSILKIERDGIRIISGKREPFVSKEGIYVRCPNCGEMIYVPLY